MKAVRIHANGGPEMLRLEEVAAPKPGAGEILIRQAACGVNFVDCYHRSGLYPTPLPSGLGYEGAGVVDAVGEGVTLFKPGDRAGFCLGPMGAYAEAHVVPADLAIALPEALPFDLAASAILRGFTARFLVKRTFALAPGHWALVHAAAGGVGRLLVQWGKALGARMIAVVSTEHKAAIARADGAEHVLLSSDPNIPAKVKAWTGEGADVVYDSVGAATFETSLKCLRPLGLMVSFGNASGPVPPVDIGRLAPMGSLFLTRPTMFAYVRTRALLEETAADFFNAVATGQVRIPPPASYPLADAAQAHRDLEGRKTTGGVVLIP